MSVWKDARARGQAAARVAVELARGVERGEKGDALGGERAAPSSDLARAVTWRGGRRGLALKAILIEPVAIVRENLQRVIDAGWISRQVLCRGVGDDPPPACR